jgi:hypothetical protein
MNYSGPFTLLPKVANERMKEPRYRIIVSKGIKKTPVQDLLTLKAFAT